MADNTSAAAVPQPSPGRGRVGRRGNWPAALIASFTALNGLLEMLHGAAFRFSETPRFLSLPMPFGLYSAGRVLSLFLGFLMLYLAFHLFQRRRSAWWLALSVASVAALGHIGRGHHLYLAPAPVVLILLLLLCRRMFTVRSEPRSITQGAGLMAISLLVALVYGTVGFWLLDKREFGIEFQWGDALVSTLRQYLLIGNADLVPRTRHATWFLDSLGVIGGAAVVFAVYSLFRPLAFRLSALPHERQQAEALLADHGRLPEHYFALWPDKSYFFSHDRSGFIAYRTAAGVAIGLSDPVAPEDSTSALAGQFLEFCAGNGWSAAFLYAQPDRLAAYERLGLRALRIGSDAIVNLEHFCAETRTSKQFRKVKRRIEEDGYSTAYLEPPHPDELVRQLSEVSRDWLTLPGRRERYFALGAFTTEYLQRCPVFVVMDADRRAAAFANLTPAYRPGMATIDMMRHRPGAPHGMMDYMFQELFCLMRERGFRTFDLGLAPMAGVGERPEDATEEKVVRQVFELLGRYFPFEGLREYKAKYEPVWEDRFLVYQGGPPGLVKTAIALARVLG
jgi:phosphatidylglycerol lysyltransferase